MSTMSDGTPVSPELDARLLADLREWRSRLHPTNLDGNRWSARLTIDELDALLRIADERDALRAASVAEWEAEIPAEVRERAMPEEHCLSTAHHGSHSWGKVPRHCPGFDASDEFPARAKCDECGSTIVPDLHSTNGWRHEVRPIRLHAAKPIA